MFRLYAYLATWILLAALFLLLIAGRFAGALTLFMFALLPLLLIRAVNSLARFLRRPLGSHGYTAYHLLNINKKHKDE